MKDAKWDIDPEKLPRHIAIIMDGNGRWAKKRLLPRTMGHRAGMSALRKTVETCVELKVSILTVFAFSTENWKRPREEIDYLMSLLIEFLQKEIDELHRQQVRVQVMGDYQGLPSDCMAQIEKACSLTDNNPGLIFNIAINYGARHEIIRAVRTMADMIDQHQMTLDEITEEKLTHLLYTGGMQDPDLLIRTAGEMRISNFLLWQIAYTELWFTKVLWPDFTRQELMRAIYDYQQRSRRFGGLN